MRCGAVGGVRCGAVRWVRWSVVGWVGERLRRRRCACASAPSLPWGLTPAWRVGSQSSGQVEVEDKIRIGIAYSGRPCLRVTWAGHVGGSRAGFRPARGPALGKGTPGSHGPHGNRRARVAAVSRLCRRGCVAAVPRL